MKILVNISKNFDTLDNRIYYSPLSAYYMREQGGAEGQERHQHNEFELGKFCIYEPCENEKPK